MSLRSDYPLIRHLARTCGYETATEWQATPLVLLPGDGFGEHLIAHAADYEAAISPLDRLPWRDVVLDFPHGRGPLARAVYATHPTVAEALDRGHLWARVRLLSDLLRDEARTAPWFAGQPAIYGPFRATPDKYLSVEVWEARTSAEDFAPWPDVALIPIATPLRTETWSYVYPNPDCRGDRADGVAFCNTTRCRHHAWIRDCLGSQVIMSLGVSLALESIAYLLSAEEYPVEVQPAPRTDRRAADPRVREKPWIREDLPHVILIHPGRVSDYRERTETSGGHAVPRPHQRRGHWRQLRAERYKEKRRLWVRPVWVGEGEWENGGQIYRVIVDHRLESGPPLYFLNV